MPGQIFSETSDHSLNPSASKSDKNDFAEAPSDEEQDLNAMVGETDKSNRDDVHAATDNALPPEGKARARSGTRSKGAPIRNDKTASTDEPQEPLDSQSVAGGKDKASIELSALKQKAMDFVQKGSEEIAQLYAHAYDDVKDVSKKVQERMKGKPHRIAMGAAGVVGLGVVLAKKYSQNRSLKANGPTPSDAMGS